MKIVERESAMVRPARETPKASLWISNIDLMVSKYHHTLMVYFFRPDGTISNFFDSKVMKDALSKVMVSFYPVAGRLTEDQNGRLQIDCQGQGALFVVAESDGAIDDYDNFAPKLEFLKLIPTVDYSLGIDAYPLLLAQVTHFKCGGVSLGIGIDHHLADGSSMMHFINSWSEMARGLDLTLPPFIDRTLLRARNPPQPAFEHIEFQPLPSLKSPPTVPPLDETITTIFKLTTDHINSLKAKSNEDGYQIKFTLYEILAGHIWSSVCKARGLQDDQDIELYIPADGRARLHPPLPPGYFGNVTFMVTPIAVAGEFQSNPTLYPRKKVHDAIAQRISDYLKSAIDYLELVPDLDAIFPGLELKCPNVIINNWSRFPIHEADFGWGQPIFMGPAYFPVEGMCFLLPKSPVDDGSISIAISLQAQHMKLFSKFMHNM